MTQILPRILLTTAAVLSLLPVIPAVAHSEMEKPLYIAGGGTDQDRCHDPVAPCRTLAYALSRVGKGGQIRVGKGRFEVGDPGTLFHLVSGVVDVRGGFDASFRQPGISESILTGVPPEYRSLFASRGFHVLADRKGDATANSAETRSMLALHKTMLRPLKAEPCGTNGQSGGLECLNAGLLAHLPFGSVSANPGAAADIWGFVDLNTYREYVLVGYNIGTGIFDVTDPATPREVGFVDGRNTTWRDIKVYQHFEAEAGRWHAYAYVTADGSSDPLFVIDLGGLPHNIQRAAYSGDFSAAHNVFATHTDYGTGVSLSAATPSLIIAGSNNGGGAYRAYTLADPANPAFAAMPAGSGSDYMHDAASIIIRDSRKDTQCVNAEDYCELLFDFNETTVDIWDITDASAAVRLSRTPYANASYTHSGWPSEDGRFLYVHDELDEQGLGLRTTVRVFSLDDLSSPVPAGEWVGPTQAIDHNGFVRGNRYYMSNYSRGLTVLDLSNPAAPVTAGLLDTYPFSNNSSFTGAWGVYPYLHSGTIAVSDIASGLYLIDDESRSSPAGSLSFANAAFGGAEGSSLAIAVERSGGSAGSVSAALELVPGTAALDDVVPVATQFAWSDGDAAPKTVMLDLGADAEIEGLEQALLRLVSPTGGATLGAASTASLFLTEPGTATSVSFDRAGFEIAERGFGTAVVVLQRRGNASGAVSVDWTVSGGDATAGADFSGASAGTLNWDDGDARPKWLEFAIAEDASVEDDEFFDVVLGAITGGGLGDNGTVRVTIVDGSGSNTAPNAVVNAGMTVGRGDSVILDGSQSNDPDGDALSFSWTQSLGPSVSLADADTASATFTAPEVGSDTLLRFELTVTDPRGLADTATTNVTVRAGGNFSSGGGSAGWLSLLALALLAGLGPAGIRRRGVA